MRAERGESCFLQQRIHFLCGPAKKVEKLHTGISKLRNLADRPFEILFQFFSQRIQLQADLKHVRLTPIRSGFTYTSIPLHIVPEGPT
ncbi:hypothetical protein D3C74_460290 [compost metagenome]